MPASCSIDVTLMRKSDLGDYTSTGWEKKDIGNNNMSPYQLDIPLGGQEAGNFRIEITVMEEFVAVNRAYYYFILQQ